MSIITDALKKAEQERALKAQKTADEVQIREIALQEEAIIRSLIKDIPNISKEPAKKVQSEVVLFGRAVQWRYIAIASFAALCAILFFWPKNQNERIVIQTSAPAAPVSQNFVTKFRGFPYVLSGASVVNDHRYAIVNGKIVQKGDSIDGAFVKEVIDKGVILETTQGEIKLKIPN